MGCDIHLVLEKKHNGTWVGVHDFPYLARQVYSYGASEEDAAPGGFGWRARSRYYGFFGELAGVRGSPPTALLPRGVPDDASALTLMRVEQWSGDGHSHTHVTPQEFAEAYIRASPQFVTENELFKVYDDDTLVDAVVRALLGLENDDGEHRVVIWFDN